MLLIALNPGFLKLGIVLLVVGGAIMGFVTKLRKLLNKNKKAFFIYSILVAIVFGVTGMLASDKVLQNSPISHFISFQVLFLVYGSIHVLVMRKFFKDIHTKLSDFWPELLYTFVTSLFGLFGFAFAIQFFKVEFMYIFLAAGICFWLPFLVVKLYEFAVNIPVPVFKKWAYPADKNVRDPKESELKNPVVISFEFNKEPETDEISNFRLKAPEQMEFGKLFYFFLNDYNERHPESKISHLDKGNNPYEWIFYTKPNFLGSRKYFDFTKTVQSNGIKENDVIICQRA